MNSVERMGTRLCGPEKQSWECRDQGWPSPRWQWGPQAQKVLGELKAGLPQVQGGRSKCLTSPSPPNGEGNLGAQGRTSQESMEEDSGQDGQEEPQKQSVQFIHQ